MNYNDERDITKKMISVIASKKKMIKENVGPTSDGVEPSEDDYKEEIGSFKSQITQLVDFTTFKVYPEVDNVIFGGLLKEYVGFEWQFSLDTKDGLFITTNNVQLSEDLLLILKKLKVYYDKWKEKWAEKIITDYKNRNV
jgi:hypothetical protein